MYYQYKPLELSNYGNITNPIYSDIYKCKDSNTCPQGMEKAFFLLKALFDYTGWPPKKPRNGILPVM